MRSIKTLVPVLTLLLLSGLVHVPDVAAATWKIDSSHSAVTFSVRHLMISNVRGSFTDFEGSIDFDGKDATKASVEVSVNTSSVNTGNEKRDSHLKNADFFNTEKYPKMTFKSTKVESTGKKTALIHGNLTLHGETHPVTLDAELLGVVKDPRGNTRAGFTATTTVKRSDFKITYNSVLEAGGVVIGDDVKVTLEIEAIQQKKESEKAPAAK